MKISYAITVCNEAVEIQRLVSFLLENKRYEDEIVILFDSKNGSNTVEEYLRSHSINGEFNWHKKDFDGHFADWKNYLTSLCNGDWIFQIDADEIPHQTLIEYLPEIILSNPNNKISYLDIDSFNRILFKLLNKKYKNMFINIGSDQAISLINLAKVVAKILKYPIILIQRL